MRQAIVRTALMFLVALSLKACIFTPSKEPPVPPRSAYAENLSDPESLIVNLAVSYRRREIEEYGKLLHPQFEFEFQDSDVITQGERLNRDQDSTGTDGLFTTDRVLGIRIELLGGAAEPATEVGLPEGTQKIRLNLVNLEVDDDAGTTFLVTDQQDMFFAPNPSDTTQWQLFLWRDNPSGASTKPGRRTTADESVPFASGEEKSWGWLKTNAFSNN